jgi:hypothetical protein
MVFPNPTSDKVTITAEISGESIIEIMDLAGNVIYTFDALNSEGESRIEIDLSDFTSGTYFVKLTNGKHINVEKLIKK